VERGYGFALGVAAVSVALLLAPFLPSLIRAFSASPGASLVQETGYVYYHNAARQVFWHDGYWVVTTNLENKSLCYFYSSDGSSWSGPRQIESVGDHYDGYGAATWKEPYPSPYVHIAYFGQDGNLYYRRGTVSPSDGTISWGERTLVEANTQDMGSGVDICVSENNVWLFYYTNNSSGGGHYYVGTRVRCLNTGFYSDLPEQLKYWPMDKHMAPLPGGGVAIFGIRYIVIGGYSVGYDHVVLTVSASGEVSREDIFPNYLGDQLYGPNIVRSGDRLYVAASWESGGLWHVSVYGRSPDGRWSEIYRSAGEDTSGNVVPVSLTATPSGGLVLLYATYENVVMVSSPDGTNWGSEEVVFHADEGGVVYCDSPYFADAGRVPVLILTTTTSKGSQWFRKVEIPTPAPPPAPPRAGVTPLYGASVSFTTWTGSGGQERTSFVLGENCTFRVTVVDAARRPVEDAVVLIRIGSLQLPVNYLGNGVYEAVLDTSLLGEGTFTVTASVGALGFVSPQPQSFAISVSGAPPKARIPDWLSAAAVLSGAAIAALLTRRRE
jgi:hypothetical protein